MLIFEGMKVAWRASQACHHERPGDAIGEGAALVNVEGLAQKGSWGEAETW